jgi:2-polyprenyl-6-methoxyphenol hydroxylase-like FAD-dependent oxidoreductase
MATRGDHAIVAGGSMAGLFVAKALSEAFTQVTVVERDPLLAPLPPKGTGGEHLEQFGRQRRGAAQAFHVHALIYGSRVTLDELYGEVFTETMRTAGAVYLDMARDHAILTAGGWLRRHPGGLNSVYSTRYTSEGVVRALTGEIDNIVLAQGKVTCLRADSSRVRVTGVEVESDSGTSTLEADLVLDATGRGSKAPRWIEALGYEPPRESVVNSHLGYATVYCRVPEGAWPGDILSLTATPIPGTTRGVSLNPQEDGLYGLIAVGQNRDYPPADVEGFSEFLRTAVTPVPYEIWMESEQMTDIHTTKTSANRLRRWHELERLPQRFVALGDAAAAFNPTYGQGIATAAFNAKSLRDRLREHDTLDQALEGVQAEVINTSQLAWLIATQSDSAFEGVEVQNFEPPPPEADEYFGKLRRASARDPLIAGAFLKAIMSLNAEPLADPGLLERVNRYDNEPEPTPAELARPPAYADTEEPASV